MIDLQNKDVEPAMAELYQFVRNPVFERFCLRMEETCGAAPALSFSKCSWEPGWNVKFRKSGKSLCTLYLREGYFTALVVVGRKEKAAVESILPEYCPAVQEVYLRTEEGNGQRWLMIDLEDEDQRFQDVLRLIHIRSGRK